MSWNREEVIRQLWRECHSALLLWPFVSLSTQQAISGVTFRFLAYAEKWSANWGLEASTSKQGYVNLIPSSGALTTRFIASFSFSAKVDSPESFQNWWIPDVGQVVFNLSNSVLTCSGLSVWSFGCLGSYKVGFGQSSCVFCLPKCNCRLGEVCSHVAAPLFYLEDCVQRRDKLLPDNSTCSDKLQQWHIPPKRTINPAPVSDMQHLSAYMYT